LRWYRDETLTYRIIVRCIVPGGLRPLARISVTGLDNVPLTGPVILAANHYDNLDAYLVSHLVPRHVHFAARQDGFGTGGLCAIWRRFGAFPADAWGIRYALKLLDQDGVVGLFPQGTISKDLLMQCAVAGMLALHSGAPVVPVAIRGTEDIHISSIFRGRVNICVRFGAPLAFSSRGARTPPRSRAVSDDILLKIRALLVD
jgi:1-acyl-sn-glycerol-3-phosphate acyltransferase